MKTLTDPNGKRWVLHHKSDTAALCKAASICEDTARTERHADSGKLAQAAADAIAAVLESRQPEVETGPAYTGKKKDPLS